MSPFHKHRDKVLGHYGTASWLRSVVLAMWNGTGYPVSLSKLTGLDAEHYEAFREMCDSYREHGEGDPAFMALADEVRKRVEQEQAAERRAADFEDWSREAKYELREAGRKSHELDDHYTWFEQQFDAGQSPKLAVDAFCLRQVRGDQQEAEFPA